jgi:L-ascorbate metabolism protein UlaG (beta-lactamase superfamily)
MSDKTPYRLSDCVIVEPLVNKWCAWSHLISPLACSLHLQNYQREILLSYLKEPKFHVQVCRDPKFRSGRFVDLPEDLVPAVSQFLTKTEMKQSANLRLAKSTVDFHNYLMKTASGESLDPYYQELPPELRGYVELVYDYYHRPTVRFFESLLYKSEYYQKDLQSLRLFEYARDGARPFFMNTPRLRDENQIDWDVSFEAPQIDELFRLDLSPKPLGYIRDLIGLHPTDDRLPGALLSSAPISCERSDKKGIRIRYFGHACVLIEWAGQTILTDPCIGVAPSGKGEARLSYKDLPEKIDYALVTHNHHDHFVIESLLRLRHRIECLIVPRSMGLSYGDISLRLLAREIGFRRVIELDALDSISLTDGAIISIPFMGEHADLPHGKTAYVVRAGKEQMLFAADSDCLDQEMYRHIYANLGQINTVFIGMECIGAPISWTCGVFLPVQPGARIEQSRRYKGADSKRARNILNTVKAERLFIYAMGLEPWLEFILGLAYSKDAIQLKEAAKLIQEARQSGLLQAELLSGTRELQLEARDWAR